MTNSNKTKLVVCLLFFGLACLPASFSLAADDEPNEALIEMISDLVTDADRDMRALGFQQIRSEMPGEAATKRFTELLAKLPPEGQAGLLEALGDRADKTAKPAVLELLDSEEDVVRAAAVAALGDLGDASDVPLLAKKAAEAAGAEKDAARQSLVRLRGDDINAAILSAMGNAEAAARVELLGSLAARNAKEALPDVLKSAADTDASVRLAAIGALRFLADEKDTAALVKIVKAAADDTERGKATLTVLVICSRGREACTDAIVAELADADVPSRIVLLRALARTGGAKSLETIVARLEDDDPAVCDEALRMLSSWPDASAVPHLTTIAKTEGNQRNQVLAIRGLARLASPQGEQPADLSVLSETLGLVKRTQEKRLIIGVLSGVATTGSLDLVTPILDDPTLAEEAAMAAVMIAEKTENGDNEKIRAAMAKVLQAAKDQQVRERAQKVLAAI